MRRLPAAILAFVATALLFVIPAAAAELALDQVPGPVMDAVKARFKDGKITAAADEKNEEGNTIYEISVDQKGKNVDISVSSEGSIFLIEMQVDRKELAKAVLATLKAKYPRAKYETYEKAFKVENGAETFVYYDVVLMDPHKKRWAVQLSPEGSITETENLPAEEEGEEE